MVPVKDYKVEICLFVGGKADHLCKLQLVKRMSFTSRRLKPRHTTSLAAMYLTRESSIMSVTCKMRCWLVDGRGEW